MVWPKNLTGWTQEEAEGRPLETVFVIVNEQTRQPVENPVDKVLRTGTIVGLANHTILVAKRRRRATDRRQRRPDQGRRRDR